MCLIGSSDIYVTVLDPINWPIYNTKTLQTTYNKSRLDRALFRTEGLNCPLLWEREIIQADNKPKI